MEVTTWEKNSEIHGREIQYHFIKLGKWNPSTKWCGGRGLLHIMSNRIKKLQSKPRPFSKQWQRPIPNMGGRSRRSIKKKIKS
jgi:hypothetical protein